MKKSLLLFCAVSLLAFSLPAVENAVPNGDFDEGFAGWTQVPGSEVLPGVGYNGGPGLKVTRTPEMAYVFNSCRVKVTPGATYILSAMIKADGIGPDFTGIGVQYYDKNGHWMPASTYSGGPGKSSDWTAVSIASKAPDGVASADVAVFIPKGSAGTMYVDCVSLTLQDPPAEIQMVYPLQGRMLSQGEMLRLNVAKFGKTGEPEVFAGMTAKVEMTCADGTERNFLLPVKGHLFETELTEALPLGKTKIHAMLQDAAGNAVGDPCVAEVNVVDAGQAFPRGACFIDRYGRAIVDGKPFLPIGLYMGGVAADDDLALFYDSDYNCIMDYNCCAMRLPGDRGREPMAMIRSVFDDFDAHGKKIIFSLKDLFDHPRFLDQVANVSRYLGVASTEEIVKTYVAALRNHPALLAWYDNDEIAMADREMVAVRRRLLNAMDPNHPTWGVLDMALKTPFFAATCDVLGVDPYPLEKVGIAHQEHTVEMMEAAEASGQPVWVVPQIFNWGVYRSNMRAENYELYLQPTPDQMRAITLLEAIRGARGFVCYSFFDLKVYGIVREEFHGSAYQTREDFLVHWQEAKDLATLLKSLSPWLLAREGARPIPMAVQAGKAEAACFRRDDGGAPAVIVASIGPDNVDATLTLPADFPPMTAQFGHAKETAPGVWHFFGNDIWGEVLLPR